MSSITIGADPELFLFDSQNHKYVPAIGLLGGSKFEPNYLDEEFALQEDNVMAEFNIPPCITPDSFVENIQRGFTEIKKLVPYDVKASPSTKFSPEELDHPQAKESGCDPYANAWNNGNIEEAICLSETPYRYCGGHLHIGFDDATEEKRIKLAKALDLFLAIPGVVLDTDHRRREAYGKAGAYRDKYYGMEYRSLSNFWLQSEELTRWVWDGIFGAIDFVKQGKEVNPQVEDIVNSSDISGANTMISQYNIAMP